MGQPTDRVRASSSSEANRSIDERIHENVARYVNRSPQQIERRIQELDQEWDIERVLETNASTIAFFGLALGMTHNKKWLIVPGLVLPFLFQHAVMGWCPPLPVLRALGVRTRAEIDTEKYALKALRGDFRNAPHRPAQAVAAVVGG